MSVLIVGASRGLGRALRDGLIAAGHDVIGVSRSVPTDLADDGAWIAADLSDPRDAAERIAAEAPESVDTVIYNTGIWERTAFTEDYDFLAGTAAEIETLVATNITSALLVMRGLLPTLLTHERPRIILTGSTSALPRSGRPEVAFGASKFALNGIADALREGYRDRNLAVSTLQLGYLNTEDSLAVPVADAAARGDGELVPVHDVVRVVEMMLELSPATFVRDITLPALRDERF